MIFLYSNWLSLPLNTRIKVANQFGIIKRGSTHVSDNMIKSDGFDIKDIETKLTVETLQGFLSSTEGDIHILWRDMLDRIENPIKPVVAQVQSEAPKKRGRPSKQNKDEKKN